MKILLLGYGKMGQTIEKIAVDRGHEIVAHVDNPSELEEFKQKGVVPELAIEFTQPDVAYANILFCLENNIPVLSGTTGWLDKMEDIKAVCEQKNGTFFYASNYSIGVNLFFKLNKFLATLMEKQPQYDPKMIEVHHTQKLDKPSGTAITLAEGVIENLNRKSNWKLDNTVHDSDLIIKSERSGDVPGTHIVTYSSDMDNIEIRHEAHTRASFALGAVLVAEWIIGKTGFLGMEDFIDL